MGLSRHRSEGLSILVLLAWLLATPDPTWPADTCLEAPLLLISPALSPPYDAIIDQLAAGLADATGRAPGVCTLEDLSTRTLTPTRIVAVGAEAAAAAAQRFPQTPQVPILIRTLPERTHQGLSRYIAPPLTLDTLALLSPTTNRVVFVHRREVPAAWLARARAVAESHGWRWEPIAVAGLREAALAIEQLRHQAQPTTALWFHRDVLALDPDILVPPLVRLSWKIGCAVLSDDAETVERGLLFALTPDYRALGRATARLETGAGLADLQWVRRLLNRRTARAIGLVLPPSTEQQFDVVYD
ncbi:hypothetical protein ThidrDRAFT_4045 [Thiorhodococcus drewsii AZ1]|uniref:ABC transporter substrate-binding protein n=1 Tax=Thiorhodococcus drewsii AZ1 TaxID=765913 RepID=G2E6Y2_9GAMM|nr:hypothetical protein [Thiorhodococcus drewsii]EGV28144.1 hypothetical protein ThidrDRAFT_4045 [Thiorhodococcus drewsii AZ1]